MKPAATAATTAAAVGAAVGAAAAAAGALPPEQIEIQGEAAEQKAIAGNKIVLIKENSGIHYSSASLFLFCRIAGKNDAGLRK